VQLSGRFLERLVRRFEPLIRQDLPHGSSPIRGGSGRPTASHSPPSHRVQAGDEIRTQQVTCIWGYYRLYC
jgi:hypothetical protein